MTRLQKLCGFFVLLAGAMSAKGSLVTNPGFDGGLAPWSAEGSGAASSGVAVVTDSGATRSLLFQPVSTSTGAFTLSFDFRDALSASVPVGTLADSLFATIYLGDSLATLDVPGGVFADSISLFDLDSSGAFNVNGVLSSSLKGAGWQRFTLTFKSTHSVMAPVFDLRDLNTVNNDSAVAFDNVDLETAPEITVPPQSQGAPEGDDVTFAVTATSERAITYQWSFNGQPITGATGPTLVLGNVRPSYSGVYRVGVSDQFGTSLSPPAMLAVLRIDSVAKTATGATVRFGTVANASYTLEANTQLGATGWTAVGAPIAGTGTQVGVDDGGASAAQRFYRLRAFGGAGTPSGYLQIVVPKKKAAGPGMWPAAMPFRPLAEDASTVTGVGAATLSDNDAPWTANQWTASPHLVRLTTGAATGRFFPITGNTATELTVDATGEDLTAVLAAGDRYEIAALPTLASFFGTTGTPFKRNRSPLKADSVSLWNGKGFDDFFNDGTGWKAKKGRAVSDGTLLFPDEGFLIRRRDKTALTLTFTGLVPVGTARPAAPGPGRVFLAQPFPAPLTLLGSGIAALPGWTKRDTVQVWDTARKRFFTYVFRNGQWRKGAANANRDATPIPPGTAFFVQRKSSSTGAAAVLAIPPPITLQ